MRFIDADALKNQWTIASPEPYNTDAAEVLASIEEAPTIDAVPVVRCKDCKYWGDMDGKIQREDGRWSARCERHNCRVGHKHIGWCPVEDDFCSYGVRK